MREGQAYMILVCICFSFRLMCPYQARCDKTQSYKRGLIKCLVFFFFGFSIGFGRGEERGGGGAGGKVKIFLKKCKSTIIVNVRFSL